MNKANSNPQVLAAKTHVIREEVITEEGVIHSTEKGELEQFPRKSVLGGLLTYE